MAQEMSFITIPKYRDPPFYSIAKFAKINVGYVLMAISTKVTL